MLTDTMSCTYYLPCKYSIFSFKHAAGFVRSSGGFEFLQLVYTNNIQKTSSVLKYVDFVVIYYFAK